MTRRRVETHDSRAFQAPVNRCFSDAEAVQIRRQVANGAKQGDLARRYRVSRGVIDRLVRGETYAMVVDPMPEVPRKRQRYNPQRWRDERHVMPQGVPRPPLDLSGDPAVQLYRSEKAKRATRVNPAMQSAAVEFARHLDAIHVAQRGGRPRGPTSGKGKGSRSLPELADTLGVYRL